jgi:FMN phosphatase YigB (HAD superfamily)
MRADVEGSHGAGMRSVWVADGSADRGPATAVIADVRELPDLLARMGA